MAWLEHKFTELHEQLGIPMTFLAAFDKVSNFRKPNDGMYQYFLKEILKVKDDDIDKEKSFYCGDAAGRYQDHSPDDLLFAIKMGLVFYTPEMLFLDQEVDFKVI